MLRSLRARWKTCPSQHSLGEGEARTEHTGHTADTAQQPYSMCEVLLPHIFSTAKPHFGEPDGATEESAERRLTTENC